METLIPQLKEEYERTISQIVDDPFIGNGLINYIDVIKAHYLIADYFMNEGEETICGVKDFNILGSALGRQITGFGTYKKWTKPEEICATLFFGLIKDHAFHDANKRTALLILLYQLNRIGRTVNVKQKEFEDLAVDIAASDYSRYKRYKNFVKTQDPEVLFIADFIKKKTREIDKRYYPITFQEFDRLLRKHGCYLEDATGNYINVIKYVKEKGFLGFGSRSVPKVVFQIGFPGWKKQVNPKALKETLKACELTDDYGIDSQSFFFDADPLSALIDEYRGPLKRLKDK